MKQSFKTLIILAIFIGLFVLTFETMRMGQAAQEITFSQFIDRALHGKGKTRVAKITIKGDEISGKYEDGTEFKTTGDIKVFIKDLINKGVEVKFISTAKDEFWMSLLTTWLPILLVIIIVFYMIRHAQGASGKAFTFGKSRAKLLNQSGPKVTFKDIAGIEEAKEELKEVIDFLKDPSKYTRLGGRIPKGVLLMGPPGTGKTLLAKGVAGEANVPFFSISGSEFVEMFVGVGAARVRDLFEQAKKNAPCIIFIDEIDAVGRYRGAGLGGGHDEREQTLNQLLVEMDGFENNSGVIVIAATNRPDVLDPALLRPGRFDRRIVVPAPDVKGREAILKVHTRKVPLAPDVNLEIIAKGTPGFVGADLENLVNEAALLAARKGKDKVWMEDFEEAKDKVLMGTARKSVILSDRERKVTAYHEAGHTIVAKMLPESDPVHKVTIIPRGMSLGHTQQLPQEDRYTITKTYILTQLAVLMGGRIAEMKIFKIESTGAGQDIKQATKLARRMVMEWGMSYLGPVTFGENEGMVFLGKELATHKNVSEATAQRIDREVKRILFEAYDRADQIISENMDKLHALAQALIKYETLSGDEVDAVLEGRELNRNNGIHVNNDRKNTEELTPDSTKKTSDSEDTPSEEDKA